MHWIPLAALLLAAAPAQAQNAEPAPGVDVTHRLGLGVVSSEAPLGFRYFWNRRHGVESGFGYRYDDGQDASTVVLEAAYLHAIVPGERVNAFLRPGVRFTDGDPESSTTLRFSLGLDIEVFLADSFSAGARTGVFVQTRSPGSGSNIEDLGTNSEPFLQAFFFYYLGS